MTPALEERKALLAKAAVYQIERLNRELMGGNAGDTDLTAFVDDRNRTDAVQFRCADCEKQDWGTTPTPPTPHNRIGSGEPVNPGASKVSALCVRGGAMGDHGLLAYRGQTLEESEHDIERV